MFIRKFIAFLFILVLLPLFLISALGIYISDKGPIFYFAKRKGKDGKDFTLIKFRTMSVKSDNESKITNSNDKRVFLFGKLLRFLKIDELPQLINILRGDMAFVGPRPEDVDIVNEYYDNLLMESLSVLPGLASPGSIYNYTHFEKNLQSDDPEKFYILNVMPIKVCMDIIYVREKNFFYDLELIIRTICVIILKMFGKKNFKTPKEFRKALNLLSIR